MSTVDYITGDEFTVGYCTKCSLHVTLPVPAEGESPRYYPPAYYGAGHRFVPLVERFLDCLYSFRAAQLEQGQRPGRVLDVGCGPGLLLNKLRQRRWEVRGSELNENAAAHARDVLKLPVTTEGVEAAAYPDDHFDLVTIWHVLEHVRAPLALLGEVARILKPGGRLVVGVPDFSSWDARWGGSRWFHSDTPRHLTHFTRPTLCAVLAQAGLSVTSISSFSLEYDFFSFIQTAQNKMGFPPNQLYGLLRTRPARFQGEGGTSSEPSVAQIATVFASALALGALSLVWVPIAGSLGRGSTMIVSATKRKPPDRTG